jgi:phage tail protein X
MDFTNYITKQGDRWDLIAWKAYGDITKQKDLIELNPDIDIVVIFDEGITLLLPIIEEVNTQDSLLPPWKQ